MKGNNALPDSWPNSMDDSCARDEWNWKTGMGSCFYDSRYAKSHSGESIFVNY